MSLRSKRSTKKDVFIMRPTDYRVLPLKVEEETANALITELVGETELIVWKHGPGWNRPDGGAMFLAVEGMPVTTYITQTKERVETSLVDFLRMILGDKYDRLVPAIKDPIETNNYAATVTIEPVPIEDAAREILDRVKAGEILKEASIRQLKDFGEAEPTKDAGEIWMNRILWLGLGAFIMYFGLKQGII